MSRDLDSRFSEREQAAVKEWLDSGYDFHFMRGKKRLYLCTLRCGYKFSCFFQTIHITELRYLAAVGVQNWCERKRE